MYNVYIRCDYRKDKTHVLGPQTAFSRIFNPVSNSDSRTDSSYSDDTSKVVAKTGAKNKSVRIKDLDKADEEDIVI